MPRPAQFSLLAIAIFSAAGCTESTTPGASPLPLSLELGLDEQYPTLSSSGSTILYMVRPKDATTRFLDARTTGGDLIWSVSIPAYPGGGSVPSLDAEGNLYIATGQGLLSLDGEGAVRWTSPVMSQTLVAVGSNRLYGADRGGGNQTVWAIDASTGALRWRVELPLPDTRQVLLDEARSTVYAIVRGGATALDANDGTVRWSQRRACFGGGTGAMAADGTIYSTCDSDFNSRLFAYTPDGEEKWQAQLGTRNGTLDPVIDSAGMIYVANGGSLTPCRPVDRSIGASKGWCRTGCIR